MELNITENMCSGVSNGVDQIKNLSDEEVRVVAAADTFLRGLAIPNLVALVICQQLPGHSYENGALVNIY